MSLLLTFSTFPHFIELRFSPPCNGENNGVLIGFSVKVKCVMNLHDEEPRAPSMASSASVALLLFISKGLVLPAGHRTGDTQGWQSGNLAVDPRSAKGRPSGRSVPLSEHVSRPRNGKRAAGP